MGRSVVFTYVTRSTKAFFSTCGNADPNTEHRPSRKCRYDCSRSHSSFTLCNIFVEGFPAAFVVQVSFQCFLVLVLPLANIFVSVIGTKLFRKHLFPELSIDGDDDDDNLTLTPTIPLLNTVTRQLMTETVFQLVKDDETQYREILTNLSTLVPYANIEDGMVLPEMSICQTYNVSRAVRLRLRLLLRAKQVYQIADWLCWPQKSVEYLLPQLVVYTALHEYSFQGFHANSSHCRR